MSGLLLWALLVLLAAASTDSTSAAASISRKRWVSYWFAPQPCHRTGGRPPPPQPPPTTDCLPDCSYTPCGYCITGCPDPGTRIVGRDGHGCNRTSGCNRCKCNAMGSRKASDCYSNLTLCAQPPPQLCSPQRNATAALDFLRREGGSQIATSFFLYCGISIGATGSIVLNQSAPETAACSATMVPGLNQLGIGAEPVVGGSLANLRRMFASPEPAVAALVHLVSEWKLRGISWDVEPADSTVADRRSFAAFLSKLRTALAPQGARVTVYSNAYSKMISNLALLSQSTDRVLDGDCYNGGSFTGWLNKYNKLLAKGVNRSAVAPAMMASTERGSWNCDNASIAKRYDRVVADRVEEIAIFTFDPLSWSTKTGAHPHTDCSSNWLPFVRRFLKMDDDDIRRSPSFQQTGPIHLTPFVCDAPDCPRNNGSLSNRSHFQIRDVSIDYCSGDGYYYLTGTTSGIFPEVDGGVIRMWRSQTLRPGSFRGGGVVWNTTRDCHDNELCGNSSMRGSCLVAGYGRIWAPEYHYLPNKAADVPGSGGNFLTYEMHCGGGTTGLMKSTSGHALGPYEILLPQWAGGDPSLFQDPADNATYAIGAGGNGINAVRLTKNMSAFEGGMTSRFGFGNNTDMNSNGNPLGRVTDNASLPQYNVSKFIGFEGPFLTFWRGSYYLSAASFGNATLHGGPGPQSAYGRDGNYNAYAGKADSIHGNFTTAMQPPWLMVPMGGHNTLFRDKTGALWSTIWYGSSHHVPTMDKPYVQTPAIVRMGVVDSKLIALSSLGL